MSGRCLACNDVLSESAMETKNSQTGDYEDLCPACRNPQLDNGIVYDTEDGVNYSSKPKIKGFFNEAEFEMEYVGGSGSSMGEVQDILGYITENGSIGVGEI